MGRGYLYAEWPIPYSSPFSEKALYSLDEHSHHRDSGGGSANSSPCNNCCQSSSSRQPTGPQLLILACPSVFQTHISKPTHHHTIPASYKVGTCGIQLTQQSTPGTWESFSNYCLYLRSHPLLHNISKSTPPYYCLTQAIVLSPGCSYSYQVLLPLYDPGPCESTETT